MRREATSLKTPTAHTQLERRVEQNITSLQQKKCYSIFRFKHEVFLSSQQKLLAYKVISAMFENQETYKLGLGMDNG